MAATVKSIKETLFRRERELRNIYLKAKEAPELYSTEDIAVKAAEQLAVWDVIRLLGFEDEYTMWLGDMERLKHGADNLDKSVLWKIVNGLVDEALVGKDTESVVRMLKEAGAGEKELKALELV